MSRSPSSSICVSVKTERSTKEEEDNVVREGGNTGERDEELGIISPIS